MRASFAYYGGKTGMSHLIAGLMPAHRAESARWLDGPLPVAGPYLDVILVIGSSDSVAAGVAEALDLTPARSQEVLTAMDELAPHAGTEGLPRCTPPGVPPASSLSTRVGRPAS